MASHIDSNPSDEQRSANEKAVEHLIDMEGTSEQQDITYLFEACIFKVHEGLRRTNPEAYTPMLISIGPYHHGNSKLSKMEKFKLFYLQSFLTRAKLTRGECLKKLKDLNGRAKNYYADDIALTGDEFTNMLLLDGCFIVEFVLRRSDFAGPKDKSDHFITKSVEFQVVRDMLLLENQLPFFVLSALYDMIDDQYHEWAFPDLVKSTFQRLLPKLGPLSLSEVNAHEIKHLLQALHLLFNPLYKVSSVDNGQHQQGMSWTCFRRFSKQSQASIDVHYYNDLYQILSVSELQDAGVGFKKVGNIYDSNDSTSVFDISFSHGVLVIPSFKVDHTTETFFRNFIAYEQQSWNVRFKYFTDYAMFLDQLINTEKDVNVLRLNGIIVNLLGDKEVTALFNKLCEGGVASSDFYYSDVCCKLTQHCNKPWNSLMAKLRRDYFQVAILLLLLSIAQTVTAFLPLHR